MNITISSSIARIALFTAAIMLLLPYSVSAATARPSCSLEVTTEAGTVDIRKAATVLLVKGEDMEIEWDSKNAKRAVDGEGDTITLHGTATVSPERTATYEYRFSNGSRKATCEVEVQVVTGSFTESYLATKNLKPTIKGKASGTRSVQFKVYKEGETKAYYTSKVIRVKNEKWNSRITKKLPKGDYTIELLGEKKVELNTIATSTLTIGSTNVIKKSPAKDVDKKQTAFVVKVVPLLMGGTTGSGKTVPISYLQVLNIGKVDASVTGFSVKQNGSASTNAIAGFTVVDGSGTYSNTVAASFKNGIATIPAQVTIPAQTMKLFTIKANLGTSLTAYLGTQLRFDVAGVDVDAAMQSTFPLRGVVWTIGY